ncbi:unnamed protein product [Trifolium pratense]|uniref:Uncharacterized protein n=1 Tax=Trifolium pratense TaxID=57577 RepID=A0ACB0K3D5_TRIPR|nr:unnamed protein product [Trifolium pratense]
MEGLIPYIIGAINRKQKTFDEHMMNTSLQHSDSSKRLLLGASSSTHGSFRIRTRFDTTTTSAPVTANNNLRNRRHH